MGLEKKTPDWVIGIFIVVIIATAYFSYKQGYKEGQGDQVASTTENAEKFCKDTLQDQMDDFCKGATQNYIEYNLSKICTEGDYISIDNCYERMSEAKNTKDKQEDLWGF